MFSVGGSLRIAGGTAEENPSREVVIDHFPGLFGFCGNSHGDQYQENNSIWGEVSRIRKGMVLLWNL